LSNDDIEELRKLLLLVKDKDLILLLPEQTKNEFRKNRDSKISDGFKRFKEIKLNRTFPQIVKDYAIEYGEMKNAIKAFETNKQIILDKLKSDIFMRNLNADKIIEELFDAAEFIENTTEIIEKAKERVILGLPPGKDGSHGDALNWEAIHTRLDVFDKFYFISEDNDYYSNFDNSKFNYFLLEEWVERNLSNLASFEYYKSLSEFFKIHYPNISIESENRKNQLISDLTESSSFSSSRRILYELSAYEEFTNKQLNDIFEIAFVNNQIFWIITDEDIKEILLKLYVENYWKILIPVRNRFEGLFKEEIKDRKNTS